jgi:translation initiation factor 1A
VGLREFGDEKGDVLMKYYDEEAKELKELGEIPEHVKINEGGFDDFEDDGMMYDGEEEKEEDDLDIDNVSCSFVMDGVLWFDPF